MLISRDSHIPVFPHKNLQPLKRQVGQSKVLIRFETTEFWTSTDMTMTQKRSTGLIPTHHNVNYASIIPRTKNTTNHQPSQCKKHYIDLRIPNSNEVERLELPILFDQNKDEYHIQLERLSDYARHLKPEQISAFWDAFMLFDYYKTCTISHYELHKTLLKIGLYLHDDMLSTYLHFNGEN